MSLHVIICVTHKPNLMYKTITLTLQLCVLTYAAFCQQPIDVTDQTIKIKATKEEEILFGFAEGDKILFNFEEVNKKDLKEVEILEYPSTSRFSEYKIDKISNKELLVRKKGVFVFRFKNTSLAGRICRIHIQRIPANEKTIDFNPAVTWITRQDTLWNSFTTDVIVGYDTTYVQVNKRELVSTEQKEEHIFSKVQRVHSQTNLSNHSKTSIFFTLPVNKKDAEIESNVIAWAYWVGVGEEANKAWQSNVKTVQSLIKAGATTFTSPLGALAIGAVTELFTPTLGEDVFYAVTDETNRNLFYQDQPFRKYDEGKGIANYKKFTHPSICQGMYFICLDNDNIKLGIDAQIKVVAIVEIKTFVNRTITEPRTTPRFEKQLKKEPIVRTMSLPVAGI